MSPVPQIGQSPSPWLSNQPVQPGPLRSTIETFCFGTGAQTADFSILICCRLATEHATSPEFHLVPRHSDFDRLTVSRLQRG